MICQQTFYDYKNQIEQGSMIKVAFASTYFESLIGAIDKKTGQTNNKKSNAAEILDRN